MYISQKELDAIIKTVKKDISKARTKLRKLPYITENFWQSEVRELKSKYSKYYYNFYTKQIPYLIDSFDTMLNYAESPSHI